MAVSRSVPSASCLAARSAEVGSPKARLRKVSRIRVRRSNLSVVLTELSVGRLLAMALVSGRAGRLESGDVPQFRTAGRVVAQASKLSWLRAVAARVWELPVVEARSM